LACVIFKKFYGLFKNNKFAEANIIRKKGNIVKGALFYIDDKYLVRVIYNEMKNVKPTKKILLKK